VEGIMSHKRTLIVITILIALAAMQLWRSAAAASQAQTLSLQQDPPTVSFDRSSLAVIEPDTGETETISLTVRISQAPAQGEAVEVKVLTVNGNAIAGEDYLPVAESLTFPAGSTEPQVLDVIIIGNNANQPDRAFVVFLTNPANGTVGIPAAITVTILDNDPIPTPKGQNYLPLIRGHAAGPTPTPYSPYPTSP
jgi:hypothetical protein